MRYTLALLLLLAACKDKPRCWTCTATRVLIAQNPNTPNLSPDTTVYRTTKDTCSMTDTDAGVYMTANTKDDYIGPVAVSDRMECAKQE